MKNIKYRPINWTDGVKLSSAHFMHSHHASVEQHQCLTERLITPFNYGLGDNFGADREAVNFILSGDSPSTMRLELQHCSGITETGIAVLYTKELYDGLTVYTDLLEEARYDDGTQFFVVVSVSPDKMCPVGIPDPNVEPLHHPYVLPEVKLHLVPKSQLNFGIRGANLLIIGLLEYKNGLLVENQEYIPPMQRLIYSPKAMGYYHTLLTLLQRVYGYAKLIYRKNIRDNRRTALVDNTFMLCDAFIRFYNQHIFELTEMLPHSAPILLFQKMQIMGQELLSTFMRMYEPEYEALLQYFYTWTDTTPAETEHQIGLLATTRYSHINIHSGLSQILASTQTIEKIFAKMSELEYVGLIRENIIISEETAKTEPQTKKSWRIIG